MKALKGLAVAAVAILLATPAYAAGGINLSWDDCGTFGSLGRDFACNTNTGANVMVASFKAGIAIGKLNGQASVVEMIADQTTLSSWWQLAAGGCRYHQPQYLQADFNFVTGPSSCLDPWGGAAAGGISYTPGTNGPNRARIRTVCAIAGSTAIAAAEEYYVFKVTISNARSVGDGSCAGCPDGAFFCFQSLQLTQPAGFGDYAFYNPIFRNCVQWQEGAADPYPGGICSAATPIRNRTWGSVKSLYR